MFWVVKWNYKRWVNSTIALFQLKIDLFLEGWHSKLIMYRFKSWKRYILYIFFCRKTLIYSFVPSSSPLVPLTSRPNPACLWPRPKLCPLSLLSHLSSLLPRCRLRPFAAHRKPWHRHRKLQPWRDKQLCHSGTGLHLERRRWRRRPVWVGPLCGRPLPNPAVLPLGGGITLQQVWTGPAAWRQSATLTFYWLHSERPKVRSKGGGAFVGTFGENTLC